MLRSLSTSRLIAGLITGLWLAAGLSPISALAITIEDPNYYARVVAEELPAGTASPVYATDGCVYLVTNRASGPPQDDEDSALFKVVLETGEITRVGSIRFEDPLTEDTSFLAQGPGGDLTSKLYVVDWIAGNPSRIDRFDLDLSNPEAMFRIDDGTPVHTLTSTIAFSTDPMYLNAGYFCAQGTPSGVWRFGVAPEIDPFPWHAPAGSNDNRGIAFAQGGEWGTELYVASSSVLNGFNDAPGSVRRLYSDGVGNFGSETTFISEASGLLEFARQILFDPGDLFDGDLLYLQWDRKLLRINPEGETSLLATDVLSLDFLPTGELLVAGIPSSLFIIDSALSEAPGGQSEAPRLVLEPNLPNPFSSSTRISFSLATAGQVSLEIFDTGGRHVRTLLEESRPAGRMGVSWDGTDASGRPVRSGVYAYVLSSGDASEGGHLVLVR